MNKKIPRLNKGDLMGQSALIRRKYQRLFSVIKKTSLDKRDLTGQAKNESVIRVNLSLSALSAIITAVMIIGVLGFGESVRAQAIDKWGGDDRVQNPNSKYQTGPATSVASYTLTDTSKNWVANELAEYILQPDINVEFYMLIKSNTQNTITVYGASSGEEQTFHNINDENNGNEQYAILNQWSVQKINSRWLLFNPYGNAFFIKSINGYNYEYHRYGNDADGNSFCTNLQNKNSVSECDEAHQIEIDIVKQMGFNTWGEVVDTYRIAPGGSQSATGKQASRYSPFISFVRISSLTLDNTDSFIMSVLGSELYPWNVWDACDPDFQSDIEANIDSDSGAKNEGMKNFDDRGYWNWMFLTPYHEMKYNIPANPYYMGIDWDEEPKHCRSENSNAHIGYYILISPGTSYRKQQAISYLQSIYSTITDLNNAWSSSFSDWSDLQSSTAFAIDPLLSSEPYCRDFGDYNENNMAMKADLDGVAEDFWRIYTTKVHDALDSITAVHKLNFGPGYHGWSGRYNANWDGTTSPEYLFRGSVSEDGSTPFIDIIGVGDPMHGPHENTNDILEYMRNDLKNRYAFHGRPYWHESCWLTSEADSGVTYTGTIDSLSSNVLYDSSYDFRTTNGWTSAFSAIDGQWILPDSTKAQEDRLYFRVSSTGAADGSLTIDRARGPGNSWADDTSPDMTTEGSAGDTYSIVHHDTFFHIGGMPVNPYNLYIPMTQTERATMYIKFLDDLINFQADNGDYIDVGYSHWEFFDYGFRDGTYEMRNWGFETVKGNLYDGVQATIANGEIQDCGNFVGLVSNKLNNIYDDILGGTDLIPPSRSNPQPTGTLTSGTTSTTISLDTDETAECKYDTASGVTFDQQQFTFDTTGSTSHSQTISGLSDGDSKTYYIRCQDEAGNANDDDFQISFAIASPSTTYSISNFINLVSDWLKSESGLESDVNGDGVVNTRDLGIMMSNWQE